MATKAQQAAAKAAKLAASKGATAPALPPAQVAGLPAGFRTTRRVTMPSLSLKKEGELRVLKFIDAFHESTVKGKAILGKDGKPNGEFESPATVCGVVDVETGEAFTLLGPTVVVKNLEENYPDDGYVGKMFAITNRGKGKSGQRYVNFDIAEVEQE